MASFCCIAAIIYFTSFLGLPKGVQLSHYNIVSNSIVIDKQGYTFDAIGDHQDVLPTVLPFFHIAGLVSVLLSKLAQGSKFVTLPKFQPDTFLNAIVKHKANILPTVPPISKNTQLFAWVTINFFFVKIRKIKDNPG